MTTLSRQDSALYVINSFLKNKTTSFARNAQTAMKERSLIAKVKNKLNIRGVINECEFIYLHN